MDRYRNPPRADMLHRMDPKQRVGNKAVELVSSGMVVGLGTGSTAQFFINALGDAIRSGKLKNIRGVPTSHASQKLAEADGIPLADFADIGQIDLTVDGADEVDENLNLIKGLGGALLREKLVAQNSKKLAIIVDSGKLVERLGTKSPLPVEVTIFGHVASERYLRSLGCKPRLRTVRVNEPFITDNGNYIYDCRFEGITDPPGLNEALSRRAGIVESGLFIGIAALAMIGDKNGVRTMTR